MTKQINNLGNYNLGSTNPQLPFKKIIALVLPLLLLAGVGLAYVFPTATNQGFAPEQPIPFSHKLHAGTNKIACQYCHVGVERSKHATIPALGVCMNCHSVVKTDSPLIQRVREAYQKAEPIQWLRIHELPDYVYFPHKRHIAAGLACETCHGDVKGMDRVYQFAPLTMGWCMSCHRGATTPAQVRANLVLKYPDRPELKEAHSQVAPTECTTCHN